MTNPEDQAFGAPEDGASRRQTQYTSPRGDERPLEERLRRAQSQTPESGQEELEPYIDVSRRYHQDQRQTSEDSRRPETLRESLRSVGGLDSKESSSEDTSWVSDMLRRAEPAAPHVPPQQAERSMPLRPQQPAEEEQVPPLPDRFRARPAPEETGEPELPPSVLETLSGKLAQVFAKKETGERASVSADEEELDVSGVGLFLTIIVLAVVGWGTLYVKGFVVPSAMLCVAIIAMLWLGFIVLLLSAFFEGHDIGGRFWRARWKGKVFFLSLTAIGGTVMYNIVTILLAFLTDSFGSNHYVQIALGQSILWDEFWFEADFWLRIVTTVGLAFTIATCLLISLGFAWGVVRRMPSLKAFSSHK